ncbi:uncharacterized protein F4822DRAFT_323329 [Hypoxylon trugodes]|uniref:uncharacterized protein n=1 Tax=Hypoxylon trugodes TaxID=326681 RepID=UPI0021958D19|nr:uncharacterized protein F4822DRAFT_323329 [Hypoxylon trugodes]KAI1386659.1 hypothetical protein F4822DRAFT_323329 [Hypoxylon trugodes]
MPPRYDEAPELAPHNFPEVHHPPSVPEVAAYGQRHTPPTPIKLEELTNPSTTYPSYRPPESSTHSPYASYDYQSGFGHVPASDKGRGRKQILGCSVLVFTLSIIIAILSITVIGLAAGTGVEANRANNAEARLAALNASSTSTGSAPASSASDFSDIDNGCSKNSGGVSGTTYTTHFFNRTTFKLYCNSDAPNNPLSSLFVGNFNDCIDACASYTFYLASDFTHISNMTTAYNATCAGVSFIPAWTNRTFAEQQNAPGNCYLKPGPQNQTALNSPNAGSSAIHAAILDN